MQNGTNHSNFNSNNIISPISQELRREETKLKKFKKGSKEWSIQYDKVAEVRNRYFDSLKN